MRINRRMLYSGLLSFALAFGVTVGSVVETGCHRKVVVTNLPAGVTNQQVTNWYTAVGAFKEAAQTTKKLTDAAIALHTDFPDEATYQKTLQALGEMAQVEAQAALFLDTVPQNWNQSTATQVKNYTDQLSKQAQIALDDGLAHVKNSTTLTAIQTTISLLRAAITTVITLTQP